MGKQSRKNKKVGSKPTNNVSNTTIYDNDTVIFISMAQELKDEGNKLFQNKDYEGAILKYQKALKLLPGNHLDVSYLHSNIAACYMQMGITYFPRAIHECNLALEVTPKYTKALLKRARCYEALNRLNLALRDVNTVLDIEPNNLMAMEIVDRVKSRMKDKSIEDETSDVIVSKIVDTVSKTEPNNMILKEKDHKSEQDISSIPILEPSKDKVHKKKKKSPKLDRIDEKKDELENLESEEKKMEDKIVVEEKINTGVKEEPKRVVKLVYGEDIRWAKIPYNCDILKLREIVDERFPVSKAVLIKYKDEEGDMVTITTNEELRWAESSNSGQQNSIRLYVFEVNPGQDPFFDHIKSLERKQKLLKSSSCIDDWILEFAHLFKNYTWFNTDSYLDLHELGIKLYSEAMEETVTSEKAQELFQMAADKFQEMVSLAFFNWGNVHMSRARKRVNYNEDDSYDWAQMEYLKAGERYKEAVKIKPDFYEGFLALSQQKFELAKLSWCNVLDKNVNLETWDSTEIVNLYNEAEDNMEKGMKIWEEMERERVNGVLRPKLEFQKTDLSKYVKDFTEDEVAERAAYMRSQMNILWGRMLYERSIMEYKIGVPVWNESLEMGVEKFEVAGASCTDIGVMIKNHCSNVTTLEGVAFDIDEIVEAWNDMYEAKMWQNGVVSFRLEPLLRRRVSNIFHVSEHA